LKDSEKRTQYDRFGLDAFKNGGHGGMEVDLSEIFGQMGMDIGGFGGGFSGLFGRGRQQKKVLNMPNLMHKVEVNISDTYMGAVMEFEVQRYCLKSGKQPTLENMTCSDCKGQGMIARLVQIGPGMVQQSQHKCDKCSGEGMIFPDEFFDKKMQKVSKTLPKGISNGETIRIEDKGHEIPDCFKDKYPDVKRTDIVLIISETTELTIDGYTYVRGFNRSPFNLVLNLELEPHEMICGTYKYVPFINGENICFKIPQGVIFQTSHPQPIIVIPQKGMPFYKQKSTYGDLFAVLHVKEKFNLDDDKLEKLWKLMTDRSMKQDIGKVLKKE